jgi:hypothetical protein
MSQNNTCSFVFGLSFLAVAAGCAVTEPDLSSNPEDVKVWHGGGTGAGFLFGASAGTIASARQDLITAGVPAALADRTTFDGTDGNVDSANRIKEIADRISCDARSGITANIALHAPGEGAAQSFKEWHSDQQWIAGLDALAKSLKNIKQADGVTPQPVYIRYAKEFNQDWPNTCVAWLQTAATYHHRSCAEELFWQWDRVREAFSVAPNVKLVWCPTGQLVPTQAIKHPAMRIAAELWPGAASVDIIGPDAYNGKRIDNAKPGAAFDDFVELAAAADKPFLISETGIVKGFKKGVGLVDKVWWTDLFAYLTDVEAQRGVDVLGVAGFGRETSFGDTTLTSAEGDQLTASHGFLRSQPERAQSCIVK